MGILAAVAVVVVGASSPSEEMAIRATQLRAERPWAATPVVHLASGTVIGTVGTAAVGIGLYGFGAVLFDTYRWRRPNGFLRDQGDTIMAVSGAVLASGLGLVVLGIRFFREGTLALRARVMANEELEAMRRPVLQ